MEELYEKILERLQSQTALDLFAENDLPNIKYIDLYRGQPKSPGRFEYFDLPALFIDYSINWSVREITLEVHAVTDQNHSTSNISPNRLKGLDIIRYIEIIKDLLIDLETSVTSKLALQSEQPLEADVVNYHIVSFSCRAEKILLSSRVSTRIEGVSVERGKIRKFRID